MKSTIIMIIRSILNFLVQNIIYLIWFCLYFFLAWLMFGATFDAFINLLLIYAVAIVIALSPIGEFLLRVMNDVRSITTNREKEYIIPIYNDVYDEVKQLYPDISPNIEICTIDAMYINAFAMGKKTIAVTRGAVESLSEEELKGFIAHEFGHIYYGHTKMLLMNLVANGVFTIFILIARVILNIVEIIIALFDRRGFVYLIMILFRLLSELVLVAFVCVGEIIMSINSRGNEYIADRFAYEVGCGEGLTEALYLLQGMKISSNMKLTEKLKASHPNLAKRIEVLENLDSKNENEIVNV